MTRMSYNPSLLDGLKKSRNAYTIDKNKKHEPFKHGAMIISRKGKGAVIGYGSNDFSSIKCLGSIHAEKNALKNALMYIKNKHNVNITNTRRRIPVDMVVLRTTGGNSKPCYHCITEQIVNNRYFNIRKIIYSDSDVNDGYVETNCNKLYETRESHYSGFYTLNKKKTNNHDHTHEHNDCCCNELDEIENDDDDEEILYLRDFIGIT
jgi:hypothetical protein